MFSTPEHGVTAGDGQNPETGQQPDPEHRLFPSAVTAGRPHWAITDPLPLPGIYLRPRRVIAAHDQRPSHVWDGLVVFVAGIFTLWCGRAVLAADDLLSLEAGGGQPPCLGQVALTWRVIASQQLSQFGG
jgi:hypothetical protein